MGILIDILILLIGYIVGVFSTALFASNGKEQAVEDAFYLGYEVGKNKGIDIATDVIEKLTGEYKEDKV